jgi:hypothetical protein
MVTKREELEAALAKAEAALANAAINAAKVDGDPAEANANLDKARAYCRRIHAALVKLNLSESIDWSGEWIDTLIKQLEEVSNRGATASPSSRQSSEHAVGDENKRSQDESRRRKPIHRFNIGFSAQERSPRDALARSTLIRQTIELLALILTYLLYFHIDVQLQILRLPSIFP